MGKDDVASKDLKTKLISMAEDGDVITEDGIGLDDRGNESFDTLTLTTASNAKEGKPKVEPCQHHLNYLPLWRKPLARQYWVKTDFGFVSSLALSKEQRAGEFRVRRPPQTSPRLTYILTTYYYPPHSPSLSNSC